MRAIQPAVIGGFEARRAGFHVVLRIEVRARGIGRAGSFDNCQLLRIPERLQSPQPRMQPEVAVEIDGRSVAFHRDAEWPSSAAARSTRRRRAAQHIQAIDRPALENRDQDLLVSRRRVVGKCRPAEPRRRRAHAEHRERGTLQKKSSGRHCLYSLPLPLLKFR